MLTQDRLKELFTYSKESGVFTRLVSLGNTRTGSIAGHKNADGYLDIVIDKKTYKAHRLAWLYELGRFPFDEIDHIDRIRNNNIFCNLREATRKENLRNNGIRAINTSGFTGIHWRQDTNQWRARINHGGKRVNLGSFDRLSDAVLERLKAEQRYGYTTDHSAIV